MWIKHLELQDLHKIWKEDIGPVSESIEMRYGISFDLTKQMHDKRAIWKNERYWTRKPEKKKRL
jgi:hypothetical protein